MPDMGVLLNSFEVSIVTPIQSYHPQMKGFAIYSATQHFCFKIMHLEGVEEGNLTE